MLGEDGYVCGEIQEGLRGEQSEEHEDDGEEEEVEAPLSCRLSLHLVFLRHRMGSRKSMISIQKEKNPEVSSICRTCENKLSDLRLGVLWFSL